MTRLETIVKYIKNDEKVLDIGCDHAYLSVMLAKKGITSIASDIKENIIIKASKNIDENLKKYITFRVGDGITLKDNEKDYTLVLSGMGSYNIINILKNTKRTFNKIITISNNNHTYLRSSMLKIGYIVDLEEIIKEKNKYYNLIIFKKGKKEYTKEEMILGINHQNIELYKERNKYLLDKYSKIIKKIPKEKKEEINNIIELLKKSESI